MNSDDFLPYIGDKNPLKGTEGAIVRMRSGEIALLPPRQADEYDLETEVLWHQLGDEGDIVAYKPLPTSLAERLARTASEYLALEEHFSRDPLALGNHPINKARLASLKRELVQAIDAYKEAWPDWPELRLLRRLRYWGDEDEE